MTLTEVRNALILAAKNSKRPPYEMYVAKEVYLAIKENTDHPLKVIVLNTSNGSTLLSESRKYADARAMQLDEWLNIKSSRKNALIDKLKIKPEFLFDLRFGLIQANHPIWAEVEAAMREYKDEGPSKPLKKTSNNSRK